MACRGVLIPRLVRHLCLGAIKTRPQMDFVRFISLTAKDTTQGFAVLVTSSPALLARLIENNVLNDASKTSAAN